LARAAVLVTLAFIIVIPVMRVVPMVDPFMTNDLALNEPVFSIGNFIYTFILSLIQSFLPF
jgi:hypothetical protein